MAITVQEVVLQGDGIVVFFNDSVVRGRFRTIDGRLFVEGFTSEQEAALQVFYEDADPSARVDIRLNSLDSLISTLEDELDLSGGGGGGGTGSATIEEESFTPSNGQTTFTLSKTYEAGGFVQFFVNGIKYDLIVDFTISGTTVTWLDTPFALATTDFVSIHYQIEE